jgi:hypothetical protein
MSPLISISPSLVTSRCHHSSALARSPSSLTMPRLRLQRAATAQKEKFQIPEILFCNGITKFCSAMGIWKKKKGRSLPFYIVLISPLLHWQEIKANVKGERYQNKTLTSPLLHWRDHISRLIATSDWARIYLSHFAYLPAFDIPPFPIELSPSSTRSCLTQGWITSHVLQDGIISHVPQPLDLEPEISLSLFAITPAIPSRSTNSRCLIRCHVALSEILHFCFCKNNYKVVIITRFHH